MEFIEFGSLEEMQDAMAKAEAYANDDLADFQIELRDDIENDRYWAQYAHGFWIFGHAWGLETLRTKFAKYHEDTPEGRTELEAEIKRVKDRRRRGYMFGWAASAAYPEGELGDTHVSKVSPIPRELFEAAKAENWAIELIPKGE